MPTSARPSHLLQKHCHCEASSQTGCGNPHPPSPRPPLPKGDCRGEAVTGGFFSRTSCNPSVGATLAVARPLHLLLCFRRGRRLPTVVPTDFRSLSCPPIGALPRNRLASSATGSASPISSTARPEFFPHPRQGTRALPYKVLRYRALADRVARSLKYVSPYNTPASESSAPAAPRQSPPPPYPAVPNPPAPG